MSRICEITDRKALKGNKRSHALNATKRTFGLNLQKTTIVDSKGKKHVVYGSAKGIKTIKRDLKKAKPA